MQEMDYYLIQYGNLFKIDLFVAKTTRCKHAHSNLLSHDNVLHNVLILELVDDELISVSNGNKTKTHKCMTESLR